MAALPKDPFILFSVINTKLRDFYPSLDALCADLQVDRAALVATLRRVLFLRLSSFVLRKRSAVRMVLISVSMITLAYY